MSRRLLALLGGLSLLLVAQHASAQHYQYKLPVEKGILESQLNLQYQYSKYLDNNHSILSVDGQYNFGRFEIGLNVPFLTDSGLAAPSDVTQIGDIVLHTKMSLVGVGKTIGTAVFVNVTLPTHSGDGSREYADIRAGAAATAQLLGFTVGGNAQILWGLRGDNQEDDLFLGLTAYARAPIFPLIALQLAIEYYNSVKPNADINLFAVTPGIEVSLAGIFATLSARIPMGDEGKLFFGGQVAGLASVGFRY